VLLPHLTAVFPAGILCLNIVMGQAPATLLSQTHSRSLEKQTFPMTPEVSPAEVVLSAMQVTDA